MTPTPIERKTNEPTIRQSITNTILSQLGAPIEAPLAAYILTMIRLANGDPDLHCAQNHLFEETFQAELLRIGLVGTVKPI